MALKDRLLKRVNAMKVEGSWRMKLAVYGGAVAMVGGILLVMYLLLGSFGTGAPEVGTVTVHSQGQAFAPLQNQIYVTQDGERKDSRRLVPAEVGDAAPQAVMDHSLYLSFDGKSENGAFLFTIYNGEGRVYTPAADSFQCPQEPGNYLVCEECYWGTQRENIGVEYYFWLEVTQEYLDAQGE